ncbi:hypothetical protein TNCV_3050231 [Trichonephila clavipes]|nr:hypothetical protein TNCV_3050231 [Trichonephila clavipes]
MTRKRAENREGSLGFPGFVKPVFTKDSKPPREKEKITRAPRERETRTHLKKSLVYADKPQTLDHLEDNIRRVIADIRPQMLEKVIKNWTSRLDYIRASRGSPMPEIIFKMTATVGSDVVQSGRPIFDDFFQHLWPYIGNNTANVVFQMVKRLWLIRIDQ